MTELAPGSPRIPPHNAEAESAVLGAVLLDTRAYRLAAAVIGAQHFYVEANRQVWRAFERLNEAGKALDLVTVENELRAASDKAGRAALLSGLTDAPALTSNVEHYAQIVLELAARRKMIHTAQQVVADGYANGLDTEEYLTGARSGVTVAAGTMYAQSRAQSLASISQGVFNELSRKEPNRALIPIGLRGIQVPRGVLTMLASRPSNGKSATAMNIACNVASAGKKVLVFSLEDTKEVYASRGAARFSGVQLAKIIERTLDIEEWPRVVEAFDKMSKLPIAVFDEPAVGSQWIRQTAAAHKERDGLDLVVVDYVQLMRERIRDRQEEIATAARGLESLARELDIAVLSLSQIRRPDSGYKGRVPPPPNLASLKGSGVLEEVPRCVILLHWPHHYEQEESKPEYLWCKVAKVTNGPTGRRDLACRMEHMWVGDPGMESDTDPTGARY